MVAVEMELRGICWLIDYRIFKKKKFKDDSKILARPFNKMEKEWKKKKKAVLRET